MSAATHATRRRGKVLAVVVAVLVAVVAAAVAVWFVAFSPKDSSVRLEPAASAVVGKPITLSGVVTPARSERVVRLNIATDANGPWLPGPTAVTDSTGHFAVAHTLTDAGKVWLRATAVTHEREQEATSASVPVTVRQVSSVKLTASASLARTDGSVSFSGVLKPAGGVVTLERSKDGTTWEDVPQTVKRAASGGFTLTLKNPPAGAWQYRATTEETDLATVGESAAVKVVVEDYKAAGKKYLELVAPTNTAIIATNAAGSAYDGSDSSFRALKRAAGAQSTAFTEAARRFRNYPGWPRKVAPTINSFIKGLVIEADSYNLMSKAATIEEFDSYLADIRDDQSAGSSDAAALREALGLPKRDPVP